MAITAKYLHIATKDLGLKVHDFENDQFYLCLLHTDPTAFAEDYPTDFASFEVTNGNGYLTGGVGLSAAVLNAGINPYDWIMTGVSPPLEATFAASGGDIGPFRYVGLYNNTASEKNALAYYDLGYDKTILDGDEWTLKFTGGLLKLTHS